jgi:hypothetical protein
MSVYGSVTLVGSAARVASGDSHTSPFTQAWKYKEANFFISATAASGTPSCTATVDVYDELTNLWYVLVTFTAITAIAKEMKLVQYGLGRTLACTWTISGGTPSLTFSIAACFKS